MQSGCKSLFLGPQHLILSAPRGIHINMILLRIPGYIINFVITSFFIWILLTTIIPQAVLKHTLNQIKTNNYTKPTYPYNSITSPTPLPIQNSTVYFIVGHPDDEVMFFSPSLIELTKKKHGNDVRLVCFSNGDAVHESMGDIRAAELYNSARILGVSEDKVTVLTFKDGMDITWGSNDIKNSLVNIIGKHQKNLILITFDEGGVLHHPNHISLYHGTKNFHKSYASKLYLLKTLNFWEKYSFTVLTNVELFVDHLSKLVFGRLLKLNINVSFFNEKVGTDSIKFYSDLNMLSVSYAAMSYGHFSQMVWFRYGWLVLSRYLTFNHLIEVR